MAKASWPFSAQTTSQPKRTNKPIATLRLTALSSTSSSVVPVKSRLGDGGSVLDTGSAAIKGNSHQKVLPWPNWLFTPNRPCMASLNRLQIASPSPVPPNRRATDSSACWKGSNRRCCCCSLRPQPVSQTSNSNCSTVEETRTLTSP